MVQCGYYFNFFFFKIFIHVFERMQGERKRERSYNCWFISQKTVSRRPGQSRSQEPQVSFKTLKYLAHLSLLSQPPYVGAILNAGSWNLNWSSGMGCQCCRQLLNMIHHNSMLGKAMLQPKHWFTADTVTIGR